MQLDFLTYQVDSSSDRKPIWTAALEALDTPAIRNAVGACPVLSNRPEHGSKRKSDLHLSLRMMLAVGPAGARNLHIHMTSQAGNSLVLQRRLHRAYINSG